jgi:hypothetical protein
MSSLLKFAAFLKDRNYSLEDLEQFKELVEPIRHADGWHGYRLKPLTQADRVTHRCKALVHLTWHCRDYVRKILEEHGVANPGQVVNRYIAASQAAQAVSYLANEHKHAGVNPQIQRWALDVAPRYGKPFVFGQMQSFPHRLKPTVMSWGDSLPGIEVAGRAGMDDQVFEFTDFEWLYSCSIEDKDGRGIGNAWGMCELTFQNWLKILADHGIVV